MDTKGSLEPGHVVPRNLGPIRHEVAGKRVEIRGLREASEEREKRSQQCPSPGIREVSVVEIDVHDHWQRSP